MYWINEGIVVSLLHRGSWMIFMKLVPMFEQVNDLVGETSTANVERSREIRIFFLFRCEWS